MQGKDYYQILGLDEKASTDEIKKAYRKIAKENHPDRNPGDAAAEERFKAATEAYDTLSDPDKRKKYDQLRRLGGVGGGFGFGGRRPQGRSTASADPSSFQTDYEDFMRQYGTQSQRERFGGSTGGSGGFGNLDDLLGNLFGGGRSSASAQEPASSEPQPTDDPFFKRKGNDAYVDLNINIAQAMLGSKIRVRTPSGKHVTVRVPAGTDPERTLRVSGMGYGSMAGTGNLYIRLHVTIPKTLTDEQKEKIAETMKEIGLKW